MVWGMGEGANFFLIKLNVIFSEDLNRLHRWLNNKMSSIKLIGLLEQHIYIYVYIYICFEESRKNN